MYTWQNLGQDQTYKRLERVDPIFELWQRVKR